MFCGYCEISGFFEELFPECFSQFVEVSEVVEFFRLCRRQIVISADRDVIPVFGRIPGFGIFVSEKLAEFGIQNHSNRPVVRDIGKLIQKQNCFGASFGSRVFEILRRSNVFVHRRLLSEEFALPFCCTDNIFRFCRIRLYGIPSCRKRKPCRK